MDKIFTPLEKAAQGAYRHQSQMFGFQGDPHLARYERLQPQDFDTISQVYGPESALRYIVAMETKRMKGTR